MLWQVFNPATEDKICDVIDSGANEVNAAVTAAHGALEACGAPWVAMGQYGRSRAMNKLADLVEADSERLATLEVMDNASHSSRRSWMFVWWCTHSATSPPRRWASSWQDAW